MPPALASTGARRHGLQVVARTAGVLRALAESPAGLGLTELAGAVALPKSTVHRLVSALEQEDLVTPAGAGRIRLGRGLIRLAAAARGSLRQELRPFIERLSRELEETVDLAVMDGTTVRFIDQAIFSRRLAAVSGVGERFPLHCTANGKALLATLADEEVARLLPARLPSLTRSTLTSRRRLCEQLGVVRAEGIAFDREEHTDGISAVGATVRNAFGDVAAVTVPMPTQRFAGREEELADRVRSFCAEATAALSG